MQVDLIEALRNYLTTFNISVRYFRAPYQGLDEFDYGLRKIIDPYFDWEAFANILLAETEPNTLSMTEDFLDVHYGFFLPPNTSGDFVIIGPFLWEGHSIDKIQWISQHLEEDTISTLKRYYSGIPVMQPHMLHRTLASLISTLYPPGTLRVVEMKEYRPLNTRPNCSFFHAPTFQWDIPAAMLERRYETENAFLDAVTAGNTDLALRNWHKFHTFDLGVRFIGSLQKRKNASIITNTLLRKAIERAKVHPYYIDEISTRYSLAIEASESEAALEKLSVEMFQGYCSYVQKYSLRQYSPLMQKVINHINLNLREAQSLNVLSELFHVSPSYLSNLFKQETGITLTSYVNRQRMERAANRLEHSSDSISSIAETVGFVDINYFTKVFKKVMGMTPSQYRASKRT